MEKPKITQEIIELYDEYTHAPLQRRDFFARLGKLAGGSAVAIALMPLLQNNYAQAAIVDPNDQDIETQTLKFELNGKEISYYQAKPKGEGKFGAVLVIHENRGLNPHIKDIVRRLAKEGFLAYAPDALSLDGGTPEDEDKAREMIKALNPKDVIDIYTTSVANIKKQSSCNGKVGAVGFCWGGGYANKLAATPNVLDASVAYYGMQLSAEQSANINIPIMLHYAGLDKRINAGIVEFVKALSENDKNFTMHTYAGVNHAFNNDTNAARYNKEAALLSWSRTVEFLKQNL